MKFPHDIWFLIMKHLPVKDLAKFSATNKEFNTLASSDLLWFRHCWELLEGYWFAVILPEKKPDQPYKEYYNILRKLCSKSHVPSYSFNFDSVKVGNENWTCINDFKFMHNVWKMSQDSPSVSINICGDSQCDSYLNNIVCFQRNKTFYEKLHLNGVLSKNVEKDLFNLAYGPYAEYTPDKYDDVEGMNCRSRLLTMSRFRKEFTEVAPFIQDFELDPLCDIDTPLFLSALFISKFLEPIFQKLVMKRAFEIHRLYYVVNEIVYKALRKHKHFEDDEREDETADSVQDDENEGDAADLEQGEDEAPEDENEGDAADSEQGEDEAPVDENEGNAVDSEQGDDEAPEEENDAIDADLNEDDEVSDPELNEENEEVPLDHEQDAENVDDKESDQEDEKETNLLADVDDGSNDDNASDTDNVFLEKPLEDCHYIPRGQFQFELYRLRFKYKIESIYPMAAQIFLQELLSNTISVLKESNLMKDKGINIDKLTEKSDCYVSEFLENYLDSDIGKVFVSGYENVDSSFCMLSSSFRILNLKKSSNYIMSRVCKLLFDEDIEDYFGKKDFKKDGKKVRRIDLTDMKNNHEAESVKMFVTDSHAVVVYVHSSHC